MDTLTMDQLKNFLAGHTGWHVSLFMPTHRAGREVEQNPIRFKNLLREAGERLRVKGLRAADVEEMLKPAQQLMQDMSFWQNQSDGLALFLTAESFHFYRLSLSFEELVVISSRFHLKPLLPFFTGDGHFYILALSQNQVRLLEGTRRTVNEIDLESMPASMAEALQYERFEKQLQSFTAPTAGGRGSAPIFHGHESTNREKEQILRWFHKIDAELPKLLTGSQSPIVLAGVDYLFPLYKEANTYPHLLDKGISGNPEELTSQELHSRAWTVVQPYFMQTQEKAFAQYRQLATTDQTTDDVQEAVLAAHHGRIATLFVAVDAQVWGRFDSDENKVDVHQMPEPGDDDLLDLAAIQSILNGGTVYAVERAQLPADALLAAVFRY